MAKVHVCNVSVLKNPAAFLAPFQFEVTFDCIEPLPEDLEWKLIYVGSAESEEYDQTLDSVFVGPVPEGRHMFVFQADPPNPKLLPVNDVIGVTVILLICQYRKQEFVRVGYYVNNEYGDPELRENPPDQIDFEKLSRNILASNPRVTRFKIDWGGNSTANGDNAETAPMDDATEQGTVSNGVVANGFGDDTANEPAEQKKNLPQTDDSSVGMDNFLVPEDKGEASMDMDMI